ncbi:MAG: hypothetical protein MUC48_04180 [Leptolyngbya sp. Prado105]|nr:hypothetical protein [Leptolyngbya sp. Prado105]
MGVLVCLAYSRQAKKLIPRSLWIGFIELIRTVLSFQSPMYRLFEISLGVGVLAFLRTRSSIYGNEVEYFYTQLV